MATIVKSIGSASRDYSTIQSFIDSIPTDVVGSGNSYVGELYNDSEFNDSTGKFSLTGKTTDATHFITIRCAAGQSFSTNPNRANNALWYNQTNGVGIKSTASSSTVMNITVPYTVVDGVQVWASGSSSVAMVVTGTGVKIQNCILIATPPGSVSNFGSSVNNGATVIASLFVNNVGNPASGVSLSNGTLINCTIVKPSNFASVSGSIGVYYNFNTCVAKNCAIFGFINRAGSPNSFSASDYNATDYSEAPGGSSATHNKLNLTYANQFVSTTNDYRLKAGSDLIDTGNNLSATYTSNDIYGNTRQTAWDIGMYEMPTPATALALSGPALGQNQVASTNFTVTANGYISSTITITPSDNGGGGTFTPSTVQLSSSVSSVTFTYTPATVGTKSITLSNNASLTNPSALTYSSANPATAIALVAPTTRARAGVQSDNFTVSINGYVSTPVQVIPNDSGDGGSFNPPFVTLDNTNVSATFTYVGVSGGVKTITTTNGGGLTNSSATITEKPPIVITPTPSTSSVLVKSIGTGKDFATVRAFTDWAVNFDLSANQQTLIGEVYENQTVSSASSLLAKNPTSQFKLIIQPVPGLSANVLDKGDPADFGVEGVELTLTNPWQVSRGTIINDMKFNITGLGNINVGSQISSEPTPILSRCRVKASGSANAVYVGYNTAPGIIKDSLFILDNGSTGNLLHVTSYATVQRSTFVRRGSATGTLINLTNSQGGIANNIINDCAFINGGNTPIALADQVPTASIFNNYTDTALAVSRSGINVIPSGTPSVKNITNDFRPADNGGLVGLASSSAIDSLDLYSTTRGGAPDVGAIQGSVVNLLPKVNISTQDVNAQSVIVSGDTSYSPSSGVAYLVPDTTTPNGAVQQGPIAVNLTTGAFSVTFTNVPPGNYQIPLITLTNAYGFNRSQTGGVVVNIIPVTATIVAGENSPGVGNAPQMSFDQKGFDNATFSISGTVDVQGDSSCTIQAYADPQGSGTAVGPINANVFGKKWAVQFPNLAPGTYKIRLVGIANTKTTQVSSDPLKVINLQAAISLPTS